MGIVYYIITKIFTCLKKKSNKSVFCDTPDLFLLFKLSYIKIILF